MIDGFLYSVTEGTGFIVTINHNHYLFGIHHCTDTNSQSCLGNQIDIVVDILS